MDNKEWQGNGWTQYQKLVLAQLEEHNQDLKEIAEKLSDLRVEISALKVQAGVWGLIAGLIPAAVAVVMLFLNRQGS